MGRLGLQAKDFFIQGEHDDIQNWTEDREGSSLLNSDTPSGRPDLHPWLHDRRVDYEGLLSRYSGDSLASIERDLASNRLLQQAARRAAGQVAALPRFRPQRTKSRVSMFVMTRDPSAGSPDESL